MTALKIYSIGLQIKIKFKDLNFLMGYETLNNILNWKDDLIPTNTTMTIIDSSISNGEFLLLHFVSNHLIKNQKVVMISFSQILNYYKIQLKKLVDSYLFNN